MNKLFVATLVLLVLGISSCEAELIKARSPESGSWGLLNSELQWKIEPIYSYLSDFNDGVAVGGKTRPNYDIIDVHGEVIGSFRANATRTPGDGLIPTLSDDDIWSYRDYSGQVVLTGYETATEFSDGLAFVIESGTGKFIRTSGETAFVADYPMARPLGNGLYGLMDIRSSVWDKYWKVVDRNGSDVTPAVFRQLSPFSEELAGATTSFTSLGLPGPFGYIDPSGDFVIPPEYYGAQRFLHGKAVVQYEPETALPIGRNSMLIDKNGEVLTVFPPEWGVVSNFHNGYGVFWVEREDSGIFHGIVDSNGEVIIEPSFRGSPTDRDFYSNGYFQLIDRDSGKSILFDTVAGEVHDFP